MNTDVYDLLVVGGGINGAGIARDAAGRGLRTLLVEKDDLASATSQWSTKLVHGGLRYLEHYEFRLVSESLTEREVLLAEAPHLVEPLSFVLPHEPHLRPAWMIRAGLFLYDHIGQRVTLPHSFGVDLSDSRWGAGLKRQFSKGFVYADARVDDARLVLANAIAAREKGADIATRTMLIRALRDGANWKVSLSDSRKGAREVRTKVLVNVSGPWVKDVLERTDAKPTTAQVRHVKGSHIVVPRVHAEDHAYILQNADKRIVFVIPFHDRYSLIGTTDVPVTEYEHPEISATEIDYLLKLANAYLDKPLSRADIVWTYSGIRPLYDDGKSDPSAITRDYVLKLDAGEVTAAPPVLSIYGGKLTTYRRLAEAALNTLAPFFPGMKPAWTKNEKLPGGDIHRRDRVAFLAEARHRYERLPSDLVRDLARRHGSRIFRLLEGVKEITDLGRDFGGNLYEREIDYAVREEIARTAEDVLWRRTKCGLSMTEVQRAAVAEHLASSHSLD